MIWLTWRQHRAAVVLSAVLAVATAALLALSKRLDLFTSDWSYRLAPSAVGAVVAVFLAAPLISREYENRTNLVAWGQDTTPQRWLAKKVLLLGAAAVVLSLLVTTVARLQFGDHGRADFDIAVFETNVVLQAAYTVFGFALGLAFSAFYRRTLVAVGATLVVFVAARFGIALLARQYVIPPVHSFRPWDPPGVEYVQQAPNDSWRVDSGYANAGGDPVSLSDTDSWKCAYTTGSPADQVECLKGKGVAGHFVDFQPYHRMVPIQLIEIGVHAVLTVALLALVFRWARKVRTT